MDWWVLSFPLFLSSPPGTWANMRAGPVIVLIAAEILVAAVNIVCVISMLVSTLQGGQGGRIWLRGRWYMRAVLHQRVALDRVKGRCSIRPVCDYGTEVLCCSIRF